MKSKASMGPDWVCWWALEELRVTVRLEFCFPPLLRWRGVVVRVRVVVVEWWE